MAKTLKQDRYLIAALILLDQAAKSIAIRYLAPAGSVPLAPFLSLTYVENAGISFGLLSRVNNAALLTANGALIGLIVWYFKKQHFPFSGLKIAWSFRLILAGALGNIADRILRGYVVDFIDFHVWPVFNFADSMITIGAGLYFLGTWKEKGLRRNDG